MNESWLERVKETVDFCKQKGIENPDVAIILGSGLDETIHHLEVFPKFPIRKSLIFRKPQ